MEKLADQKCNVLYFILDDQWFNLTPHDMKTVLVNAGLEYHRPKETPGASMSNFSPPLSPASIWIPIHLELAPHKKGIKSDDPPKNVDISHFSDPPRTTTNLDKTCPLDTSCGHLVHPASYLNYEIIHVGIVLKLNFFLNQRENWIIPTFHQLMFSVYTMTMNYSYYKRRLIHHMTISIIRTLMSMQSMIKMSFLTHVTILSLTFALPQFMAQHNCDDLDSSDTPSTVPTAL